MSADTIDPIDYGRDIRRYRRNGLLLVAAFIVGLGGWSALAPLSSAVIAVGRLEVAGSIKKIQHETGGTVAEIRVSEGSRVTAGDLLIRLDATNARAGLDIVNGKIDEQSLAVARLRAERDGLHDFGMPPDLADRAADADVAAKFASEARLFTIRRDARQGQKDELTARIGQFESQIAGLTLEATAKARELEAQLYPKKP